MICRNCGLETPVEGSYCIHCGSSLIDTARNSASDNSTQENDINVLQREIRRLRLLISNLNGRLSSIEREHGILPVDFEPVEPDITEEKGILETLEQEPEVHEAIVEEQIEKPVPVVETWISPVEETTAASTPAIKKEPSAIQR